jgi:acyl-CoA dehydrogenase
VIDYGAFESAVGLNFYEVDPELKVRVERGCPPEDLDWARGKLSELGALIGDRIARNADVIDANPPVLVAYDRWANDANRIEHHPAALDSKRALWEAGYVSNFAADEATRGRPAPGAMLAAANYLLSQADTGMVCSLGMTSGVAGLVQAYAPPDLRDAFIAGLRATSFEEGADGSMFLTEREGGSDLGTTVHCTARDIGDGRVLISGEKWFCSNIDGAMIAMLARPEGAPEGPGSIGLYLVPKYRDDGSPNSYRMRRLKQKLGTKSVPTGEVVFEEALGYALRPYGVDASHPDAPQGATGSSDAGGLNRMMEMVNGSRFGVALMGLGIARRSFLEAAIWAWHRRAKGRLLVDLPLVREQMVNLLAELEAAIMLAFECATAARQAGGDFLRRILVPASKVRLTRLGIEAATQAIELVGGNGYCEDWGLTRLLRDAQCHTIWEGSENICQLDVLRAVRRHDAHEAVLERVRRALSEATAAGSSLAGMSEMVEAVDYAAKELESLVKSALTTEPDHAEALSAPLTALMVEVTSAALLVEDAALRGDLRKGLVALRYVRRHLHWGVRHDARWGDSIAQRCAREILSYSEVSSALAASAAA